MRTPTSMIRAATRTLIEHVDELTALDQAIGDGDHGLNMRRGAMAIETKLDDLDGKPLSEALKQAGMICMSTIGGSSGPVFGTLLVTLGKELPAQPGPADLARALDIGIAALTRLGKAEVGQKTLLDVLAPVQVVLAESAANSSAFSSTNSSTNASPNVSTSPSADLSALIARVCACALDSAEATAQIPATRGRSSFLGERALGHVDPGSRSMALIIAAICDQFPAA